MAKVTLKIEIVLDELDAEEVAADIQKLYWNHRIGMHSYKTKVEKIPVSFCKACGDPIFKETSNSLCEDSICTIDRQIKFNKKKKFELNQWKFMMCDKCTEDKNTLFCYINDNLIQNKSTCIGCIFFP